MYMEAVSRWAGCQRKFRPCSFPWCSEQAKACTSMAWSLRKDMEFQHRDRRHHHRRQEQFCAPKGECISELAFTSDSRLSGIVSTPI